MYSELAEAIYDYEQEIGRELTEKEIDRLIHIKTPAEYLAQEMAEDDKIVVQESDKIKPVSPILPIPRNLPKPPPKEEKDKKKDPPEGESFADLLKKAIKDNQ